ncbi:MAG TPA: 4'-phosphopantetheinyl transferase superfamily protein [Candidatus Elarobacter sp.]
MCTGDKPDPVADAIRRSMPAGAVFAGGPITGAQEPLYAQEEEAIRRAVPKRRAEFRAGRTYARAALLALGVAPVPILAGKDRAPVWPPGITASITHDDTYCGVIAATVSDFAAVGIDIDSATPLDADLVRVVCSATELEHRAALEEQLAIDVPKLIFCAKESTYKAYFSLTRVVLDFPDVEIRLAPAHGAFTATVLAPAPPLPTSGRAVEGRFLAAGGHLVTWAAVPAGDAIALSKR